MKMGVVMTCRVTPWISTSSISKILKKLFFSASNKRFCSTKKCFFVCFCFDVRLPTLTRQVAEGQQQFLYSPAMSKYWHEVQENREWLTSKVILNKFVSIQHVFHTFVCFCFQFVICFVLEMLLKC